MLNPARQDFRRFCAVSEEHMRLSRARYPVTRKTGLLPRLPCQTCGIHAYLSTINIGVVRFTVHRRIHRLPNGCPFAAENNMEFDDRDVCYLCMRILLWRDLGGRVVGARPRQENFDRT